MSYLRAALGVLVIVEVGKFALLWRATELQAKEIAIQAKQIAINKVQNDSLLGLQNGALSATLLELQEQRHQEYLERQEELYEQRERHHRERRRRVEVAGL
ncbi:hypothetical protein LTR37_003245 [Vermiconidia calcicola]|uniref:Uncharacterized protein n=1 Tax=Vermiconidia calcicola TaxID=1690605 RepID=A0ACC3NR29_9PEZI|nr:hypothetical protein LTR37_003245 [Vermiconidia calcicola]